MTKLIDITRPLQHGMAVWPDDTPFQRETILTKKDGHSVNLTTLHISSHTGTHVDAPYHFTDDGLTMEQVDLTPYWGPAQVVTVTKQGGPLHLDDFANYDLTLAPRLLVRTPIADLPFDQFPAQIVHPSPELAAHLGQLGLLLYGTDAPSMDATDSTDLPGHHALHAANILILEGLDLRQAPDGLYELVAFPLKITGGDGSPVRAVLRTL
ncbi:MAG TPA: cyclase family protein [Anaerolineae bacterium]|nr:cyclase family protein [Anaerolineae bacterium]